MASLGLNELKYCIVAEWVVSEILGNSGPDNGLLPHGTRPLQRWLIITEVQWPSTKGNLTIVKDVSAVNY